MPEKGKMVVEVEGDLRKLRKGMHDIAREPFALELDDKKFSQPLGRITGKLGEFDKSLDASNARVIAFGASAGAIYAVQRALKETVSAAIQVEKSLADINVILGANEKNLARFGDQLFRIAGQTGQSFQVVATAATELARQGLSVEQTLKRTSDALVLTRLSGLDAVSSVESLTAAINSFNRVALTSTEIVNKLANVDAAFAVSSGDLAEALRRVGSTASDAGVSFDQLIAAVTSAQQTTARGGSVIGNSFKTIFTRLQRPAVLRQLEQLGVKTKGVGDSARPVISILTDLAKTYDKLSSSQRANISELVGGVFQINIVKAALADLGKEYSIYDRALATSVTSTDEAIKRNQELNKTLSSLINRTFANLQKVGAKVGEGAFGPAIKNVLELVNSSLAGAESGKQAEGFGATVAQGIFKGLGDFLSGPGLVIGLSVLGKLFFRLSTTMLDAFKSIQGQNKATMLKIQLEKEAFNWLSKNPDILAQIKNKTMSVAEAQRKVELSVESSTQALNEQYLATKKIVDALMSSRSIEIDMVGSGASKIGKDTLVSKASGHIPSEQERAIERSTAAGLGYSSGTVKADNIKGVGRVVYGSNEDRVQFPGMSSEAIMPPRSSKAGRRYGKSFQGKHGFDPYEAAGEMMAGGMIPNFAKISPELGFGHKFGNTFEAWGSAKGILGPPMYGAKEGINSNKFKAAKNFFKPKKESKNNPKLKGKNSKLEEDDYFEAIFKIASVEGVRGDRGLSHEIRSLDVFNAVDPAKGDKKGKRKTQLTDPKTGGPLMQSNYDHPVDMMDGEVKGWRFGFGDSKAISNEWTSHHEERKETRNLDGTIKKKRREKHDGDIDFLQATIGKHLRATLIETPNKIGRQLKENLTGENSTDNVNLGNYLISALPDVAIPTVMGTKGMDSLKAKQLNEKGEIRLSKRQKERMGGVSAGSGSGWGTFASGFVPNFASRTYEQVTQRMTQMLFGPKPTIAGFNNNDRWMNLLNRPGNQHLAERYQTLKSASMERAAKTASRSAEIGKEVVSGAKVNTLFLENLASPTVSPRKPNVRRHGFDPSKLPNVRKTFINSLGTRWKGLMGGVAGDVFDTIPPDKLKSMGGKAKLMGGLNIRNLTEAPVALGQVTGRLFEEFINSMSTVVNKNVGETGTERLDMSNRKIKTKYQGLFTPSDAMGLGGQGMEIRSGDITNKKALEKAGLMAGGSIPNFAKPLYDLDGTIIKEGFFNWKDPERVLGATAKDLTPLGKQLLQSGENFDIATARGLRDKRSIMESLSRMGLNVGKVFPMGSMYTSRTEMGKRGKPIKMRGPTKKGLFANTLKRELIDNDPANVQAAGKYGRLVDFSASGHIPNFSLGSAVARERAAGVPSSAIRVGSSPSLKSAGNPGGVGVYNTIHEPAGLGQGVNRYRASGLDPRKAGVPNFATTGHPILDAATGGDTYDVSAELKKYTDEIGKESKGVVSKMKKWGASEGFKKWERNALTASFVFPMVSGQLQSLVGTDGPTGKAFGALSDAIGTGTALMGVGGPWGAAIGLAIGGFTLLDKGLTALSSTTAETKKAAEDAKEKFTRASNSIATYGQTLQSYQEALKMSGDQTQVIIRLQNKMADTLKDVPAAFQNQILSAKNATDLQENVAKGLEQMAKETASLDFAAKLDAMVEGERSGFAQHFRRRGDSTKGGETFDIDVFEEIPGAAKAMANDLKKAVNFKKLSTDIRKNGTEISKAFESGDQKRVLAELRKNFGLTSESAKALGGIMGQDLGELFSHLSKDANVIGHVMEKTKALTEIRNRHGKVIDGLKGRYDALSDAMSEMIKMSSLAQTMWVEQSNAMAKFTTQAEKLKLDDIIGDGRRAMKAQSPFMSDEARARGNFTIDAAKRRAQTAFTGRTAIDTAAAGRKSQLITFQESVMGQIAANRKAKGGTEPSDKEKTAIVEFQKLIKKMTGNSRITTSAGKQQFDADFVKLQNQAMLTVGTGDAKKPHELFGPSLKVQQDSLKLQMGLQSETSKQTNALMMLHQSSKAQEAQAKKDYDAQVKQLQTQRNIAAAGKAEGFASGAGDKIMGDFSDAMAVMRFGKRSGNAMLTGRGATMAEMSVREATGGPSGNMAWRNMAVRGRQQQLSGMFGMMGLRGHQRNSGQIAQQNMDALFRPQGVPGAVGAAGAAQLGGFDPAMLQAAHSAANANLEGLEQKSIIGQNTMINQLTIMTRLMQMIEQQEVGMSRETEKKALKVDEANAEAGISGSRKRIEGLNNLFGNNQLAGKGKEIENLVKRLGGTREMNSLKGQSDLIGLVDNISAALGVEARNRTEEQNNLLKDTGTRDFDEKDIDALQKQVAAIKEGTTLQIELNRLMQHRITKERSEFQLAEMNKPGRPNNFSGYLPNFSRGMEKAGVKGNPQYSASQSSTATPQRRHINGKPTWLNTSETVVPNFAGSGKQAVLTPAMRASFGMADGHIPNFAFGGKDSHWDTWGSTYAYGGGSGAAGLGANHLKNKRKERRIKHGGKLWSGHAGIDNFLNSNLEKKSLLGRKVTSGTISKEQAKKIGNIYKSINQYQKLNPDFYKGKHPFGSLGNMMKGMGELPSPAEIKRIAKEMGALESFLPNPDQNTPRKINKYHAGQVKTRTQAQLASKTKLLEKVLDIPKGHVNKMAETQSKGLVSKRLQAFQPNTSQIQNTLSAIITNSGNPDMTYKQAAEIFGHKGGKTVLGAKMPHVVKAANAVAVAADHAKREALGKGAGKTTVTINRAPKAPGSIVAEATKKASVTAGKSSPAAVRKSSQIQKWENRAAKTAKARSGRGPKGSKPSVPSSANVAKSFDALQAVETEGLVDKKGNPILDRSSRRFTPTLEPRTKPPTFWQKFGSALDFDVSGWAAGKGKDYFTKIEQLMPADLRKSIDAFASGARGYTKDAFGHLGKAVPKGVYQNVANWMVKNANKLSPTAINTLKAGKGLAALPLEPLVKAAELYLLQEQIFDAEIAAGANTSSKGISKNKSDRAVLAGLGLDHRDLELLKQRDQVNWQLDPLRERYQLAKMSTETWANEGFGSRKERMGALNPFNALPHVLSAGFLGFDQGSYGGGKQLLSVKEHKEMERLQQWKEDNREELARIATRSAELTGGKRRGRGSKFSRRNMNPEKIKELVEREAQEKRLAELAAEQKKWETENAARDAGRASSAAASNERDAFWKMAGMALENNNSHPDFNATKNLRSELGGWPTPPPFPADHRVEGRILRDWAGSSWTMEEGRMKTMLKGGTNTGGMDSDTVVKGAGFSTSHDTIVNKIKAWSDWKKDNKNLFLRNDKIKTHNEKWNLRLREATGGLTSEQLKEGLLTSENWDAKGISSELQKKVIDKLKAQIIPSASAVAGLSEEMFQYLKNEKEPYDWRTGANGIIPNFALPLNTGRRSAGYGVNMGGTGATGNRQGSTFDSLLMQTRHRSQGSNKGLGWFQNPFYRDAAMSNPGMRGLMNPTGFNSAKSWNTSGAYAANGLMPSVKASQSRERRQSGRSDVYTRYVHTPNFAGYATFNGSERGMEESIVRSHPNPKRAGSTPNFASGSTDIENALKGLSSQLSAFTESMNSFRSATANEQGVQSQAQVSMSPLNVNINHSGKLTAEVEAVQTQVSIAINNAMKQIAPALWRTIKGPATA